MLCRKTVDNYTICDPPPQRSELLCVQSVAYTFLRPIYIRARACVYVYTREYKIPKSVKFAPPRARTTFGC